MTESKTNNIVVFPEFYVNAKIKKVVMGEKAQVQFEDLEFSPEQYMQLEKWRVYGDPIAIVFKQLQANI